MLGVYAALRSRLTAAPWWQAPLWVVPLILAAVGVIVWLYLHDKARELNAARMRDLQARKDALLAEDRDNMTNELDAAIINVGTAIKKTKEAELNLAVRQEVVDLASKEDVSWDEVRRAWDSLP